MKNIVSIIIVHWNTPLKLKRLLKTLSGEITNLEVIVIDNASDSPVDWVKKEFPFVRLVSNKMNLGFAFACNRGTVLSKGDWLLFLNPDVEISPSEIIRMKKLMLVKRLAGACPETDEPYQKPLPTVLSIIAEFTPLKFIIPLSLFETKTLFGGCLMIKKSVLWEIGGWDERFFLWFEDADLTARLIKGGYETGRLPIKYIHTGGSSFVKLNMQEKLDIFFLSMETYALKHFAFFQKLIVKLVKNNYSRSSLLPNLHKGVGVVIPNIKAQILEDFFKKNSSFLKNGKLLKELIVVSSSIDSTNIWRWRSRYPQIRFIGIKENRGFAPTVNIGLRVTVAEFVATINDDTVSEENWIENCLLYAYPETGSINPIIYSSDGTIESAGISVSDKGKALAIVDFDPNRDTFDTQATNAAAVIYNKQALNRIGLFDERFGSYLEDIDLSLRLNRNGYANTVVTKAKIIHRKHGSSLNSGAKKAFLDFKNWILIVLKNWGPFKILINFPWILIERGRNFWGIVKSLIF